MGRDDGSFMKGILLGAAVGAAAGILFAPKPGAETRADIKKKAGELQEKSEDLYAQAQKAVSNRVTELKAVGQKIDKSAYNELVSEVLGELRSSKDMTAETTRKLGAQLGKDWVEVKKALKG